MTGQASARNTDPLPCHEVARKVEAKGTAASLRTMIYAFVQAHPLFTAGEIEYHLCLPRYTANWRLNDLHKQNLVEHGPERVCTARNTVCVTWKAV